MILGSCYICGKPATHICKICGRPVCDEHYVPSLGMCVRCAAGRTLEKDIHP